MTILILLFAVGILLIAAEVIVPGGVLGSLGALLMFGGCVVAFNTFGNAGGLIAVLAALTLGGLAIYFEFWYLPRTKWGKRAWSGRRAARGSWPRWYGPRARPL